MILIISPHFDDAVLSCWAYLSNQQAEVLTVFGGMPEPEELSLWDSLCGFSSPAEAIEKRRAEDQQALNHTNTSGRHLDFIDSSYQPRDPDTETQVIREAIRPYVKEADRILIPAISNHPDHMIVKAACLELDTPKTLYAESVHANNWGWPYWVSGEAHNPHHNVDFWWQEKLKGIMPDYRERAHVVRICEEKRQAKLAAVYEYKSQIPQLERGVGAVSHPLGSGTEVYWEL